MYAQLSFPLVASRTSQTQPLERQKCLTDVEQSPRNIKRIQPRYKTVSIAHLYLCVGHLWKEAGQGYLPLSGCGDWRG